MQLKKILQSFPKQKESFDLLINTEIAKKHVSGLRLMDQHTAGGDRQDTTHGFTTGQPDLAIAKP